MVGEMSVWGNVLVGKCPVGEVSFGEVSGREIVCFEKCPLGKCPLGKCQSGICPQKSVSRGTVQSGNCPAIIEFAKKFFFIKTKNKKTEFKDALETLCYYIKETKPNNEVQ